MMHLCIYPIRVLDAPACMLFQAMHGSQKNVERGTMHPWRHIIYRRSFGTAIILSCHALVFHV